MGTVTEYLDVFHKFTNRESSIQLKLKALEKMHMPRSPGSPKEKNILTYEELENDLIRKRIDTLGHKNASSRNMSFLKELNIAETQLRLMACFCPTDLYLQACKTKFLKMKSILDTDSKNKEKSTKRKTQICLK